MQVSITGKICNCSAVIIKILFLECIGCIERLILFDCHIVVCIHIFCFSCMLILLFLNFGKYFNSLIALDLGQNILFGATMQVFLLWACRQVSYGCIIQWCMCSIHVHRDDTSIHIHCLPYAEYDDTRNDLNDIWKCLVHSLRCTLHIFR